MPSFLFALATLALQVPFESDIRQFEEADAKNPPAKGSVLFVGSSSIRLWNTLAQDFPGVPVINRGFGGSQIIDSVRYVHRIVTPYEPRMIVLFAGTNDIANGKSGTEVFADFKAFVGAVREKLPTTPIVNIAITPAPSRWHLIERTKLANRLIREYCESHRDLTFVDTYSRMLDRTGRPRPELFVSDQLHLNAAGYALWADALRPIVMATPVANSHTLPRERLQHPRRSLRSRG